MKKILLGTAATLAALAVGGYVSFTQGWVTPADILPAHRLEGSAEMSVAGLTKPTTLYRDSFGVPHIFGENSRDMMVALGYSVAQDRLFQFEMARRLAAGQLAEVLGPDVIDLDKDFRLTAYSQAQLDQMFSAMTPRHQDHLTAYVEGLNLYLVQMREDPGEKMPLEISMLDIELRNYTPQDVLSALSIPIRTYGSAGGRELVNLAFWNDLQTRYDAQTAKQIFDDVMVLNDPDAYSIDDPETAQRSTPPTRPVDQAQLRGAAHAAQHGWALSGREARQASALSELGFSQGASRSMIIAPERSENGKALLMQATADGHEVQMRGGGFDMAGMSFVMTGLPVMGRSESFGYVVTTTERDTVDIFAEQLNPENRHQYWHNGAWRDMELRREVIHVAGADDVEIEVALTVHGPVVEWDEESGLAYAKSYASWMSEGQFWAGNFERARAQTAEEFAQINATYPTTGNYSIATSDGRIATWHYSGAPIRAKGIDPRLPTPGTGEYDWTGREENLIMPTIENPARGYNFIWNNKPLKDMTYGDTSRWGKHFRTHLPLALLHNDTSISVADLKSFNRIIAAGWGSPDLAIPAPEFYAPFLREVAKHDPKLAPAVEAILSWDGLHVDADGDGAYDNVGLTLFRTWWPIAMEEIMADDIGDWWHRMDEGIYIRYGASLLLRVLEGKDAGLPPKYDFFGGEARVNVVARSLKRTLETLSKQYGSDDLTTWHQPIYWRYVSDVAQTNAGDDALPVPLDGLSAGYSGSGIDLGYLDEVITHNGLPGWVTIMEFDDGPARFESLIPSGGQNWFISRGLRASPHINDQYKRHRDFDFKLVEMNQSAVAQDAEYTLIMTPER